MGWTLRTDQNGHGWSGHTEERGQGWNPPLLRAGLRMTVVGLGIVGRLTSSVMLTAEPRQKSSAGWHCAVGGTQRLSRQQRAGKPVTGHVPLSWGSLPRLIPAHCSVLLGPGQASDSVALARKRNCVYSISLAPRKFVSLRLESHPTYMSLQLSIPCSAMGANYLELRSQHAARLAAPPWTLGTQNGWQARVRSYFLLRRVCFVCRGFSAVTRLSALHCV